MARRSLGRARGGGRRGDRRDAAAGAERETPIGLIGLLAQPDGAPSYERLRERAGREVIAGVAVRVASLDDLIAMKKAAGRRKDLLAVEELEAIQRRQRERGAELPSGGK